MSSTGELDELKQIMSIVIERRFAIAQLRVQGSNWLANEYTRMIDNAAIKQRVAGFYAYGVRDPRRVFVADVGGS